MWKERDGKRVRTRSRAVGRDDATARRLKDELERNLKLQGLGFGVVVPFSKLAQDLLALLKSNNNAPTYVERVRIVFRHIERIHPGIKLPALTAEKVDEYKTRRLAAGTDANTVRREVGVIKWAAKKARRFNYIAADLSAVEKPQGVQPVHMPYTLAEVSKLLEGVPPIIAMVIRLGLYAGLRRMEILALKWAHIDWDQESLILGKGWRTKNRRARAIPISRKLLAALKAWREHPAAQGSEHVIPWKASLNALTMRVTYWRRKLGIPAGAIHTARRTFFTHLKKNDVDTGKAMRLGGQRTEKVTQGYVELEVSDLRPAVETLNYEGTP